MSPLGRHELAVCCWIILDPAAWQDSHDTRAPYGEGAVQWLVHDTQITRHQISQMVKSYSFETHGASMIYESREFF